MCRLAFIPGQAKITKAQMLNLLDDLEVACGGDGNGYVAISPNGEQQYSRGVKLENTTIVNQCYKLVRQGWALYYHTRKISVGWSDDKQCHPFRIKGPKFDGYLCHNGTWYEGSTLAKYFKCGSDTAALARLIGQFGVGELKARDLFPGSGVFLLYGAAPGETPTHKVIKVSGDLEYCAKSGIWASRFDNAWVYYRSVYEADEGSHMLSKPAPQMPLMPKIKVAGPNAKKNSGAMSKLNPWTDKVSPMWLRDRWHEEDWDQIDKTIDSTYVDRNLLS